MTREDRQNKGKQAPLSRLADALGGGNANSPLSLVLRTIDSLSRSAGMSGRSEPHAVLWIGGQVSGSDARTLTSPARAFAIEPAAPANAEELEALLVRRRPRLMVVDVDWCAHAELAQIRHLHRRAPNTDWLLLWDEPSPKWLDVLVQSGARGALTRGADDEAVALAFDAVLAGEIWLSRRVMQWLYAAIVHSPNPDSTYSQPQSDWAADSELTTREEEVIELMRRGLTNREIGERLGVSINTVKKHLANAFEKRGLRNRRQLLG